MLGITIHHYVRSIFDIPTNPNAFAALPVSANKLVVEIILLPIGKISVIVFFTISAWFLSTGSSGIKNSFRRAWLLERELLFWSITLLLVNFAIHPEAVGVGLILRALFPTTTNIWWYATSYIIFLLLFPFLTQGLHAIGRINHLFLCVTTFLLWSVAGGFLPQITFNMPFNSVFAFIYLYVLVTYVRWYSQLPSMHIAWAMIGLGMAIIVAWVTLFEGLTSLNSKFIGYQLHIADAEAKLPVVLIGFGCFILFAHLHFINRFLNRTAKSALSVFLITMYPGLGVLQMYDASASYNSIVFIFKAINFILAVYIVCTLLDFIRQGIFKLTVDRNRGLWFDRLWERASAMAVQHL